MVVAWDVLNSLETLVELAGGEFHGFSGYRCRGIGNSLCPRYSNALRLSKTGHMGDDKSPHLGWALRWLAPPEEPGGP